MRAVRSTCRDPNAPGLTYKPPALRQHSPATPRLTFVAQQLGKHYPLLVEAFPPRLFGAMAARAALLVALAALAALAAAQATPEANATLFSRVTPVIDLSAFNDATIALFQADTLKLETPVAIRLALGLVLLDYDRLAACHPTALSFLGLRVVASEELCATGPRSDDQAEVYAQALLRWLRADYPTVGVRYGAHLETLGLNSTDGPAGDGTLAGFGRGLADAIVVFFASDGWNSKGDLTRTVNRRRFEDTSGYQPQNAAHEKPDELSFPLRWQPITQSEGDQGRFVSQVHVAPHLGGVGVTPLAATREDLDERRSPSPYKNPDLEGDVSEEDVAIVEALIDDLFNTSRSVTPLDLFLVNYWENKVRDTVAKGLLWMEVQSRVVHRTDHNVSRPLAKFSCPSIVLTLSYFLVFVVVHFIWCSFSPSARTAPSSTRSWNLRTSRLLAVCLQNLLLSMTRFFWLGRYAFSSAVMRHLPCFPFHLSTVFHTNSGSLCTNQYLHAYVHNRFIFRPCRKSKWSTARCLLATSTRRIPSNNRLRSSTFCQCAYFHNRTRHDLVRPTTIIRRLRAGKNVTAFLSTEEGVQEMAAEDWEPIIPVQGKSIATNYALRLADPANRARHLIVPSLHVSGAKLLLLYTKPTPSTHPQAR